MNDNVTQFSMSYNKFLLHLCFKSKDAGLTPAGKIGLAEVSCSQIYKATMKTTYLMEHISATKMNLQVNLRGKIHCGTKS